jgi:hypothetical protein
MKHAKKSPNVHAHQLNIGLLVAFCILPLLFIAEQCNAQKTKTIPITKSGALIINCVVQFDESNLPTDTLYHMMGRDARYTAVVSYITLKGGTMDLVTELLNKCLEAFNEDDGTSFDFEGSTIRVTKMMGAKLIALYGDGSDRDGFTLLNKNQINKAIEALSK